MKRVVILVAGAVSVIALAALLGNMANRNKAASSSPSKPMPQPTVVSRTEKIRAIEEKIRAIEMLREREQKTIAQTRTLEAANRKAIEAMPYPEAVKEEITTALTYHPKQPSPTDDELDKLSMAELEERLASNEKRLVATEKRLVATEKVLTVAKKIKSHAQKIKDEASKVKGQ